MRHSGSHRTCRTATHSEAASSHPAITAMNFQPVKIAANPTGTTADISGTTNRFAVSPVSESR